jgi:hypothetical protein
MPIAALAAIVKRLLLYMESPGFLRETVVRSHPDLTSAEQGDDIGAIGRTAGSHPDRVPIPEVHGCRRNHLVWDLGPIDAMKRIP